MRSGRLFSEWWKIKREIETNGDEYKIFREQYNEDLEPTGEVEEVKTIKGILHISGSYVSRETNEGTETRTKRSPMLMCLWEDSKGIKNRDFVIINNQRFNVINKRNVNEFDLVCDMSMEVVLNGNN